MPESGNPTKGQPGLAVAALFGLCPQCGAKGLFGGIASFAPRCRACGLDYSRFNVGDGPAAFLIMVIGAVVVALALWVEFSFDPPIWVHVVLWAPVIAAATLGAAHHRVPPQCPRGDRRGYPQGLGPCAASRSYPR
jgi:uncharacterized protein (DUF983 family)